MGKQPNLETERLLLVQFIENHADDVQALAGNYQVAKNTLNIPHPYEEGMAEAWISTHQHAWDEKKSLTYAILLKPMGRLIGAVGLVGIHGDEASMGYWVGEPYWGKGYCTEAANALLDFCFNDLKLTRIEAEYLVRNPASGRVMEKLGMFYKTTRMIQDRQGKSAELNVYEIYAE